MALWRVVVWSPLRLVALIVVRVRPEPGATAASGLVLLMVLAHDAFYCDGVPLVGSWEGGRGKYGVNLLFRSRYEVWGVG